MSPPIDAEDPAAQGDGGDFERRVAEFAVFHVSYDKRIDNGEQKQNENGRSVGFSTAEIAENAEKK
jgi:hypothetical protein